jgi:uncharacterized protein with FMN-binding domain
MKRSTAYRSLFALASAGLASTPIGGGLAVSHAARPSSGAAAHAKATVKKFKGPVAEMHQWGPLQVTVSIKGKKITSVSAPTSPHTPRSQSLQSMALPLLKAETLRAQNASIDTISGATDTSEAYIASLTGALQKAHLKTG